MSSVVFWSRLEPSPWSFSLTRSLQARVRDPAWMLARQWQLGEFAGEDAGSPVIVQWSSAVGRLTEAHAGDSVVSLDPSTPLEAALLAEPPDIDDSLSVEVGLAFGDALEERGGGHLLERFLRHYPVSPDGDATDSSALLGVAHGRVIDGAALLRAADDGALLGDDASELTDAERAAVDLAVEDTRAMFGIEGRVEWADPPAWKPDRLEYYVELAGHTPSGEAVAMDAHPSRTGEFAWYAFDESRRQGASATPSELTSHEALAVNATFRGMPHPRWWQFEDGQINLPAVQPSHRDLASLLLLEFALVASNDWYLIPLAQPLGSLCSLRNVSVVDTFGERHPIPRSGSEQGWSMFTTTAHHGVADYLLVPSSTRAHAVDGPVVEQVAFTRDEMANLAWAVHTRVPDGAGGSVTPHLGDGDTSSHPGPSFHPSYRIQSSLARPWTPFVPVAASPTDPDIALQRARRVDADGSAIAPPGRLLAPTSAVGPYRIREEEIPGVGVTVTRKVRRSRWLGGRTVAWTVRTKRFGSSRPQGELRFDFLDPEVS